MDNYDYIIAGAGCAGLSLMHYILKEESLLQKKILVIDKSLKKSNDRTWCFWEQQPGVFESIVYHRWNQLIVQSIDGMVQSAIQPYQ